jgi:hypothetical protein
MGEEVTAAEVEACGQPNGKGPEECWLIRWIAQHPPM